MSFKWIVLVVLGLVITSACKKDDGPPQQEIDQEIILAYLASSNLDAEEHPSGLYFDIEQPGGSAKPTLDNKVIVRYKGYFTDGTVFDETPGNSDVEFLLRNLIPGWQIGIPLIGKGGSITLVLPSHLAYGAFPPSNIPANAVLIFEIDLVDFN